MESGSLGNLELYMSSNSALCTCCVTLSRASDLSEPGFCSQNGMVSLMLLQTQHSLLHGN